MTKLLQQCFLFFIVVVMPGHNLGNIQVSVNRTIGPTLVISSMLQFDKSFHPVFLYENYLICIFIDIKKNFKIMETPLDKIVFKGVIRPTLNTPDIFL